MILKKIITLYSAFLFIGAITIVPLATTESKADSGAPTVKININPYTIVYEGDIIDCDITGNPTILYWMINNQSHHTTFYNEDPIIFDPEPTPLNKDYVTLTVYAENAYGNASDSVQLIVKRIYFGDIHWHSKICDGDYPLDTMYKNAVQDNYLDFAASTSHSHYIDAWCNLCTSVPKWDLIKTILQRLLGYSEWQNIKDKAIEYYTPGKFSTLLGFEWTASSATPGGWKYSPNGWNDVCHINFYYRDIYPDAHKYSDYKELNYNMILEAMAKEYDKGHLNFGFPHHPQAYVVTYILKSISQRHLTCWYTTNWSFLANKISNPENRNKILRGAEVYSRWGTAIGQYYTPDFPWLWPYRDDRFANQTDSWIENAMWEWSSNKMKNQKFVLIASSDTHQQDRPGSALIGENSRLLCPSGIIAAYAVHNTRGEIWDAINNCSAYASQLLKIRANIRFDGQMALGQWINCSSPLNITITAQSTFPGYDSSGKNMKPHSYLEDQLDYPIQDIWLIKKDNDKGRPWCKVINHTSPNTNTVVVNFQDFDVQPNDFYWVAIRQKGEELKPGQNEYMAFIGPVFIDNVV
jgi:hypothetical protein